jgi:hypothetical protein
MLRSWSHAECEAVTHDLSGRAIELGHLEALIPVFRIAHTALDADDRQVGEANVFPPALRLDRETEWRVCQYPGSRYREALPMNVTALKAMIKHWKPMMTAILAVRDEMIARLGSAMPGRPAWTIGELHTLSCVVLAVPAFVLMRHAEQSPPPPLHPVLSSLFRITDGIRMVTHDMIFSIEHTQAADQAMSARALFDYAEKYGAMIGDTGVCAGPNHLIHEFLTTVIDGAAADHVIGRALPDEVDAAIAELPAAFDYGLYGLQAWALVMTSWVAMSRAVEAMRAILDDPAAAIDPRCARLADRLAAAWDVLTKKQLVTAYERDVHIAAYRDVYERSYRLARAPIGAPSLDAAMAPVAAGASHAAAAQSLRASLATVAPRIAEPLIEAILTYARAVQAVLTGAVELEGVINRLLDRAAPRRALTGRDLVTVYWIGRPGGFPELFDVLEALGVRLDCTADAIELAALDDPRCLPDRRLAASSARSTRALATTNPMGERGESR